MIRQIYFMIVIAFIGATLGAMGTGWALGINNISGVLWGLCAWVVLYYALLFGQYAAARAQVASMPVLGPPYPGAVMGSALIMWILALIPFNVLGHTGAQLCGIVPGTMLWEVAANLPSFFPLFPALWLAPRAIALDEATPINRQGDN